MKIPKEYLDALPVGAVAGKVNESLDTSPRLVVTAPTGSGKSTLLPLTIAAALPEGKVVMLEPRRAAARQIARRMAAMLGEQPGLSVGYRMRFESKCSESTRVLVVTEGVMERMLVDDPTLDGVEAVIFDEFHERSLTADLALALTLEAQRQVRPDLKVVVMSATLEADSLCRKLDAPCVEAEGKLHEVVVSYASEDCDMFECPSRIAAAVKRAYREQPGNILAFLPGAGEIAKCRELLEASLPEALVLPLHGTLPPEEQYRAIEYNPSASRKIVLATPIAETSLTIEGIRTVVDSGFYRVMRYMPSTGLDRLATERISLDMASQRSGRAGRLSDGVCYRLWTKATASRMKETRIPEIEDADLCSMLLSVAAWGGGKCEDLPWLTPPPANHLADARRLLRLLGALGDDDAVTSLGRRMASLPAHPRIAGMLIGADSPRLTALAADIAALLEEKDPLDKDADSDADICTRIALLRQTRARGNASPRWKRIIRIAEQYRRMMRCGEDNSSVDSFEAGSLIASAYPERVACRLDADRYRLPGGENVSLSEDDPLSRHEYLAVAAMGKRIFLAAPLSKERLLLMAVPHENVSWSSREGRLVARKEARVGVLVIESRQIEHVPMEKVAEIIASAAPKEGLTMFDFNENVAALQRRTAMVAEWHPELKIPAVDTDSLLAEAAEWLPLFIGEATSVLALRKIDLCKVIEARIGYELMMKIDRLAPTHIPLPSGRRARVVYRQGSPVPIVSARLQDCLGLFDTPCLDGGRCPVLMELLSPGFKPVQLTRDLRGFWSGTYFEVRKELRRRYPRHRWPEDPFSAC